MLKFCDYGYHAPQPLAVNLTRTELARSIEHRLDADLVSASRQWAASAPINHFVLDDLLPPEWTREIHRVFPSEDQMSLKRSLRELKFVAAQMNKYHPLLEESIYAFQAPGVVERIHRITGLQALEPDEQLYAGGISLMAPGHFLNPHIDNSHDKYRRRYRVLNLLYYVSPDWREGNGCNLELWPDGPKGRPTTIVSKFNRLVVMVTHGGSWHSVSRNVARQSRCCVSNYYFSSRPAAAHEYFHVTSFRGRPEQPLRDLVLRADIRVRMLLRKAFPLGVRENPHYYEKDGLSHAMDRSQTPKD